MSNAYYTKTGMTATPTTDPDFVDSGGNPIPCTLLEDDNSDGLHGLIRNSNVFAEGDANRAISIIIKPISGLRYVSISTAQQLDVAGQYASNRPSILVDLQTETILNGQGAVLEKIKDGVYLLFGFVSGAAGGGANDRRFNIIFSENPDAITAGDSHYQGTSSKKAIVAFPQLSKDHPSQPSSPILTVGAATATRSADNISLTGASDLIGQTEGFLYALVDVRELGSLRSIMTLSNGAVGQSVRVAISSGNNYQIINTVISNTTISTGTSISALDAILVKYGAFGFSVYINGVNVANNSVLITTETKNTFDIGRRVNNTEYFNDHIFLAGLGTTALTEAQALTLSGAHL
jgi:hypothetical protein